MTDQNLRAAVFAELEAIQSNVPGLSCWTAYAIADCLAERGIFRGCDEEQLLVQIFAWRDSKAIDQSRPRH